MGVKWYQDVAAAVGAVSVAVGFGLVASPTAAADEDSVGPAGLSSEVDYLSDMEDAGFEFPESKMIKAIELGYFMCDFMDAPGPTYYERGQLVNGGLATDSLPMQAAIAGRRNLCEIPGPPAPSRSSLSPTDSELAMDSVAQQVQRQARRVDARYQATCNANFNC